MTLFASIPTRILRALAPTSSDVERIDTLYRNKDNRALCESESLARFWESQVIVAAGFREKPSEQPWFERMVSWWYYRAAPQRIQKSMDKYPQMLEMALILGNYPAAVSWVAWLKQYPAERFSIEFASKVATLLDNCFSKMLTPGHMLAAEVYQTLAERLDANGALARDVENYYIHALRNLHIAKALYDLSEDSIFNATNGQPDTFAHSQQTMANQITLKISASLTANTIAAETIHAQSVAQRIKDALTAQTLSSVAAAAA